MATSCPPVRPRARCRPARGTAYVQQRDVSVETRRDVVVHLRAWSSPRGGGDDVCPSVSRAREMRRDIVTTSVTTSGGGIRFFISKCIGGRV
jgi:hypothetical protein